MARARGPAAGELRNDRERTEGTMGDATRLWNDLEAHGIERLRIKRGAGASPGVIAAEQDGDWRPLRDWMPEEPPWVGNLCARFCEGGHERLDLVGIREPALRFICAVHDTTDGPGAGGLRRHDLVADPLDVIQDALNLSRAMTYKNRAAGVERGGSKICLHAPPIPSYDRERYLDILALEIDLSGTITGPDSGLFPGDFVDLAKRTPKVAGVQGGGTGASAALGVHAALMATAAALGAPLGDLHMVVMGIGSLGSAVASRLVQSGARLTVTDRDFHRIDAFMKGRKPEDRSRIGVVAPYQVLEVAADVLVPCAVGGLFTLDNASRLYCRSICGGANNQLASRSLSGDLEIARALHSAGTLFVPDWLASAGGTIHGTMEHRDGDAFDLRKVQARVHRVCGEQVDQVLGQARRTGRPPLEIAVERLLVRSHRDSV